MRHTSALLALTLLASACTEDPTPKQAEKTADANAAEDTADAVKLEKKTIEQAAEAAVKLVEEESRQEIDGLAPIKEQ